MRGMTVVLHSKSQHREDGVLFVFCFIFVASDDLSLSHEDISSTDLE